MPESEWTPSALFMNSLSESGFSLDVGCPESVESADAVMRQGSCWPVWLAGQRPEVM